MGVWGKIGKGLLKIAPYAAMAIPGVGIPLGMAIQGGIGAAQGAASGGGWKSALKGGLAGAATGAIPVKGLGPSKGILGKIGSVAKQAGKGILGKTISGATPPFVESGNGNGNMDMISSILNRASQAIPSGRSQQTGIGPSPQIAMNRMDQSSPNLAYALQSGRDEALMDQPWRRRY